MSADDLRAFYQRYYVAQNATVVIVGDVSEKQARSIAARLADSLDKGSRAELLPAVAGLDAGEEIVLQHPSKQSHVLLGAPGMRRGDADYFPLYVGNHILGGSGLVSRISEEIREKRGLAYSAYSYFIPMERKGPYLLGFQTRNDQREPHLVFDPDTIRMISATRRGSRVRLIWRPISSKAMTIMESPASTAHASPYAL